MSVSMSMIMSLSISMPASVSVSPSMSMPPICYLLLIAAAAENSRLSSRNYLLTLIGAARKKGVYVWLGVLFDSPGDQ